MQSLKIGQWEVPVPIIQGGMGVGVSLSGLAGAVAREGGIGVISTAQIGFAEEGFERDQPAANLRAIRKHIARAKEMKPSVLFLSYGMNDVGAQNGDADGFIKAYRPVIGDLKKSLPDTKIYVNSILPTAQIAIDQNSVYAKIPEFNQKLKKLCEKEKVTFIDNTELVKQEYYAGDGIHMSTGYYKEWVNHMAEVAEL